MAEIRVQVRDAFSVVERRITIPVTSGEINYQGVDVVLRADPGTTRDPLNLAVLGGAVRLSARTNGWYTIARNGEVVVDRTTVDTRPDNTSARRPYWFRLRVQTYRGKRDIYAKVWPDSITMPDGSIVDVPEPAYWDSLWYQDADPTFLAASGPVTVSAPGWTVSDLAAAEVLPPEPPVSAAPERPNLADDYGLYSDGRDQSLELAAALRNLLDVVIYAEPRGQYGIEQPVMLNGWRNVTVRGRRAEFIRTPLGTPRGAYLAYENVQGLEQDNFTVRGAFQWRDSQVWFAPGIRTLNVQRAWFHDFFVYNTAGDGVLVRDGSEDVTLERFHIEVTGRQLLAITNADRTLLQDGFGKWSRRSFIDLEPYIWSRYVRGTRIIRVRGETFTNYFVAGRGASDLYMIDSAGVGGLGWLLLGGRGMRPQGSRTIVVDVPLAGEPVNTPLAFWVLQSEAADEALQNGTDALWDNRWLHMNSGPASGHWRPIVGHESDTFTQYTVTREDGRIVTLTNHRARVILESPLPAVPQAGDSLQAPRPASEGTLLRNSYDWEDPDWNRDASMGTEIWAHTLMMEENHLRFRGTGLTELYIRGGRIVNNIIDQAPGGLGVLINTGGRPRDVEVFGNRDSQGNLVPVTIR